LPHPVFVFALLRIITPDPYATEPVPASDWFLLSLWGVAILGLLIAWRWELPSPSPPEVDGVLSVQLDQPFTITIDQLAQLTEKELNLTFLEVLEDSRCPSNVECAEAGQARISINVTQIGQTPATLEMNTNPPLKQDVVTYENFQIRLLALNPYPEDIDQHIPMETYEAILVITDSP
jgi:hypothetical protein